MDPRAQELILRDVPPPIQRRHSIRARVRTTLSALSRNIYFVSVYVFRFTLPIYIYLSIREKKIHDFHFLFFLSLLSFLLVRTLLDLQERKRQATIHSTRAAACRLSQSETEDCSARLAGKQNHYVIHNWAA